MRCGADGSYTRDVGLSRWAIHRPRRALDADALGELASGDVPGIELEQGGPLRVGKARGQWTGHG
jgi:hypothetical protein